MFVITSAEKIGTIELGEYPQTYVGDELNKTLNDLGDSISTGNVYTSTVGGDKGSETYVVGRQVEYSEYQYQGERYVKVNVPDTAVVRDGDVFSSGTEIQLNATYYFRVEPIKWDIFLQDNRIIAVSQFLLGSVIYNYPDKSNQSYKESYLRYYINNYFLQQARINNYVDNRTYYSSDNGSDLVGDMLNDKLWLPSIHEIQILYPSNLDRIKKVKDYVRVGTSSNGTNKNDTDFYFLRTVGSANNVSKVKSTGEVYTTGW